jgi:RNA polymerase sigma factor for flagellar operon FliA
METNVYNEVANRNRRDRLILEHLGLVRHVLGKLVARLPSGLDVENLESAGVLGLVEAASKFDPARGIRFEAFAYPRIRGAVLDELRRNCPLPQQVLEQAAQVRRAFRQLPGPVTVEDVARATSLTTDTVLDCLAALRLTRTLPWREPAETAQGRPGRGDDRPEHGLEEAERRQQLARAIAALPERARLVVTLYYLEDLRLKEIGRVLGLSESRVSRLLDAALVELGQHLRALGETLD